MGTPRKGWSRILFGLVLAAFALLVAACAPDAPQDVLKPEGLGAREADRLWDIVFPIAAAIFFIVEGVLVFAIIKFRHRPGREAKQFHGNTKIEVALTAIPALILAGIAVPTVRTIFDLAEERPGSMQVTVRAHQFWWEYEYDELGIFTANELYIPVGQPVRVRLEGVDLDRADGTEQVIHSFWVPRLMGAQDVVPGRAEFMLLQADRPGEYWGECKEYCGLSHANMRLRVIAQPQEEFDAWVEDMQATEQHDASLEGARIFAEGADNIGQPCSACHAVEASPEQPNIGPNLGGFSKRGMFAGAIFENNEENLAAWLRNPEAVKPGAKMPNLGLTSDQINALIEYLQSLE
jgi:cytochrome c oxidase subunit II